MKMIAENQKDFHKEETVIFIHENSIITVTNFYTIQQLLPFW